MIGCGDDDLYAGGLWEFSELFDLIRENLDIELREKLRYRIDYRGSDHSAFLDKGVTSISLRTGNKRTRLIDDEHPEYHRPGDTPAVIQPELLELAAAYHLSVVPFLADYSRDLLDPQHRISFIHKNAKVADMHCDTIGRALRGVDLAKNNRRGHVDIPKLKEGAVDLQVFACFVGPPEDERQKMSAAKRAFDQIDAVHQLVEKNPEDLILVTSYEDLDGLRGNRKCGLLIGIEGGYAIENDLRLLRSFYRNGVRLMTLTHWLHTDWADASGDEDPPFGGLTEFGEEVVREMNRLGMIIDVSHAHDGTFWDVLRVTDSPVVASHSCCRALSNHHRNLTDEMLKALAENGGVIGINFLPGFLNADNSARLQSLRSELLKKYGLPENRAEYAKAGRELRRKFSTEFRERYLSLRKSLPEVNVATVVDHIEHVIKVTGSTDFVGLGSDFDGINSTPKGLEHAGRLPAITVELVKRGYEEKDINKILGGNFLRVLKKVCSSDKK
jgi:membrane dipeptidase